MNEQLESGSRTPPQRIAGLAIAILICLVVGWFLIDDEDVTPEPSVAKDSSEAIDYEPPSELGFVGNQACAECHAEIAESYAAHPMSNSTRPVDRDTDLPQLSRDEARVPGSQRLYEVESSPGLMVHHELMYDAQGELIYDQAVAMDYVVGSGQKAKAYLYHRDDLLFMSPLNWYSEDAQWDFAPAYKPDDPRRFERRATDDCLGCHAGRLKPAGRGTNRYQQPAFQEYAISCERCHGPGQPHIDFQNGVTDLASETTAPAQTDPIVNPARLSPELRESVCYQCHLHTTARVLRPGRTHLDFRPGQSIEDTWVFMDVHRGVDADGNSKANRHVQQLRSSVCFQRSNGEFGCISCHDPHRKPLASERISFYRERCNRCHENDACTEQPQLRMTQDDSCIACHMPQHSANNISHVSQTDHRVLRRAQTPPATVAESKRPFELEFFNDSDKRLEQWERNRSHGLGTWLHATGAGEKFPPAMIGILRRSLDTYPDDPDVLTTLGILAVEDNLIEQAEQLLNRALKLPRARESALTTLHRMRYVNGMWNRARELSDEVIQLDPGNASFHAMRADILYSTGEFEAGIESARRALKLNPTLIPVHEWLIEKLDEQGHKDESQQQQELLERIRNAQVPDDKAGR